MSPTSKRRNVGSSKDDKRASAVSTDTSTVASGQKGEDLGDRVEDGNKNNNDNSAAPKRAPTGQAKLPVYCKQKPSMILSPKALPTDRSHTRAVCTIGLRCGANLFWIETDGKPAYVWPLIKHCKDDPNAARVNWKIDYCGVKRDPKDPARIYEYLSSKRDGSGSMKRILQNVFIRFPEGESEHGVEFRKKWGELMVQVFNSPGIQKDLYGPNTLAYYAGDLTPKGENAETPYLSDFLTLKNTIDALEIAYGRERSRDDIVNDDLLLSYYFPKKRVEELRENENNRRPSHAYMAMQDFPTFDGK